MVCEDTMFGVGLENKTYEACSYSLFFALKYDFKLASRKIKDKSFKSEDCIYMTLAYLYEKKYGKDLKDYRTKAIELQKKDFDRNWIFIYEVLKTKDFDGEFKAMKKQDYHLFKKNIGK